MFNLKDVNGPLKTLEDPLLIDAIEGRGSAAPETSVDEKEDTKADATFPIRFPVVAPENKENVQEEYASEQTGIKICTVKDRRIIHISSPSQKIVNSLFPKYSWGLNNGPKIFSPLSTKSLGFDPARLTIKLKIFQTHYLGVMPLDFASQIREYCD